MKPQIVTKKEFKGIAFISKPEKIVFKDFDVGRTHVKTILVTNVSLSFDSFKELPNEDQFKDFFDIEYTPTGRMSAGLSTTIQITFLPKQDNDINTVLPLLSETGPINIPLICTCKKALLDVDNPIVDFGKVIYGEEQTVKIKMTNAGALPARIYIRTPDGKEFPVLSEEEMHQKHKQDYDDAIKAEVM